MHDLMFAHTPYFKTRIIHQNVLIFIIVSRKIKESEFPANMPIYTSCAHYLQGFMKLHAGV